MLRSIFSKGLEAPLLELLVAARKAGIENDLWNDVVFDFMSHNPFEKLASNWIESPPRACARRHYEVTQVIATMRDLGPEPLITSATEALFQRSCGLGLVEAFPERTSSPAAVIEALKSRIGGPPELVSPWRSPPRCYEH
jgi:hypothetical protein